MSMLSFFKKFIKRYSFVFIFLQNCKIFFLINLSKKTKINGRGNHIRINSKAGLSSCGFNIIGDNNSIDIEGNVFLKNVFFKILGNNNHILISDGTKFVRSGELWMEDDNCEIVIDKYSTFEEVHIAVTESGSKVYIGKDCMFAYDIDIRTGDSHSIINSLTGERINYAKNIEIGNHVWVASHVSILKGAKICDNSVVATRSVLSRPFDKMGILIGGIPAIQLKEGITWDRKRL